MSLPSVPLAEVARPISRPVVVRPGTFYRTIGVKWWGGGAYERRCVDGAQTAARTLSLICEGDLIINKIWVRHGSIAVASRAVDGCAASGEFPTFELNTSRVLSRWIHWLSKSRGFWDSCAALSHGTSGKNRIKPERFLTIAIPLPSLPEQQRILTRIEEVAAKVEEARRLRRQTAHAAEELVGGAVAAVLSDGEWPKLRLEEILREKTQNGLSVCPSEAPGGTPILRISAATSRGDAVVDESDFKFAQVDERTRAAYRLEPGDLLAVRFNGNRRYVGRFCLYSGYSGECQLYPDKLIRFRLDTQMALPEFVRLAANARMTRAAVEALCATTAGNIGVSAGNLKTVRIPVPPVAEQKRVVAYLDGLQAKASELKRLQTVTARELDALIPSVLDKAFRGEL